MEKCLLYEAAKEAAGEVFIPVLAGTATHLLHSFPYYSGKE